MRKKTRWHDQQKSVFRSTVDLRIGGANDVNTDEKPTHNGTKKKQQNNSHNRETIKLNCMLSFYLNIINTFLSFSLPFGDAQHQRMYTINGKTETLHCGVVCTLVCFSAHTMPTENKVMKMERFWWNQITISMGISIFEIFLLLFIYVDAMRIIFIRTRNVFFSTLRCHIFRTNNQSHSIR